MPATSSAWTTFEPETLRERKIASGISGLRTFDSRSRKPPSSASETAPSASVCGSVQPSSAAGLTIV